MKQVSIPSQSSSIPISVAHPIGMPKGGVLIIPSIFGNDEGTLGVADTLSKSGILAVVPSLFYKGASGPCGFDSEGKQKALNRMKLYNFEEGIQDLQVILKWMRQELSAHPNMKIIGHGICFGGHLAGQLALNQAIEALSTVHGGRLDQISTKGPLKIPATLHFGDQDSAIPMSKVNQVHSNWPNAEIVIHQGAGHGFAHPGSPNFIEAAYHSNLNWMLNYFN